MTIDSAAVRFVAALVVVATSGCATIIKGTGRDVTFTSNPKGASIYVKGKFVGRTPIIAKIDHGRDKVIEARMPGYAPAQSILTTSFSGHSLWLAEFSLLIDALTGSMFTVDEGSLHLELEPLNQIASTADPRYATPGGDPRYATPGGDSRYAPPTAQGPPVPVRQSAVSAAAQKGNKRMAVLEFAGKNLDQDILMTFSDTVRGGALQGLDGRGVVVMTRENMQVLLRDMGKQDCGEGDCEVETARNIGADYVISGKVVRMEQIYVVTLKLHETQGGSLIGTDTVEASSQVDLLRSLHEHARQVTTTAFSPRQGPR
jgi:TolB-like protein